MRHAAIALVLALAACSAPPSKPAEDPAAKPAPKVAPVPAPVAKPAPVDVKPVTLDLTKFKAPSENAELFGYNDGDGKLFYYTAGAIELQAKVPADGDYEIAVKASCDEAQGQKAKWTVAIDGKAVGEQACTSVEEKEYTLKATLKAGDRKIAIAFLNDLFKEGEYDLNFYVHGVTLKPGR